MSNLKLWFLLSVAPTAIALDLIWLAVRRKPRPAYLAALGHCYWDLAQRLHGISRHPSR